MNPTRFKRKSPVKKEIQIEVPRIDFKTHLYLLG